MNSVLHRKVLGPVSRVPRVPSQPDFFSAMRALWHNHGLGSGYFSALVAWSEAHHRPAFDHLLARLADGRVVRVTLAAIARRLGDGLAPLAERFPDDHARLLPWIEKRADLPAPPVRVIPVGCWPNRLWDAAADAERRSIRPHLDHVDVETIKYATLEEPYIETEDDYRAAWEERAAIMEYDGGIPRAEAERLATEYLQ